MLIHADEFFSLLMQLRKAWIRGAYGSGKTLLAVALTEELFKRGLVDGCLSNIDTVFPERLDYLKPSDGTLFRRVMLVDEAHEVFDNRTSMTNDKRNGAYLRKFKAYMIAPSIYPIDKRERPIIVWRDADFFGLGLLWIYHYILDLDYKLPASEKGFGWFALWRPSKYFDRYDTSAPPDLSFAADIAKRYDKLIAMMSRGRYSGSQMRTTAASVKLAELLISHGEGEAVNDAG